MVTTSPDTTSMPTAPTARPSCTTISVTATLLTRRTDPNLLTCRRRVPATPGPVFRKST